MIPGFLPVSRVKPKMDATKNTRVTQINGSLDGKDVLSMVQKIGTEKDTKQKAKEERKIKKQLEKEAFFKCKDQYSCKEGECQAAKLKQCPSCHDVLKSVCSKAGCIRDGKKPSMITAASACQRKAIIKDDDFSENEDFHDSESESEDVNCSMMSALSEEDENEIVIMKRTWAYLSPPNEEKNLIGKWFAVCYKGKKSESLYISKVVLRFLIDKDGPVECLLMKSLKPKVGSGTILEDTPSHLPADESMFDLHDVIAGPIDVNPLTLSARYSFYNNFFIFFHFALKFCDFS